jgi:transposase
MAPAAFALNYVHRVWPYALPGGLALALVTRFNTAGLAAIEPRHGGGPPVVYDATVRERILRAFRRTPDREQDGTATWSLTTLERALRRAPDGLPRVSTWLIFHTLHEAGYTWQESRTWCHTGYGFHALALS